MNDTTIFWELISSQPDTAVVRIGETLDRIHFEDGMRAAENACAAAECVILDLSRTRRLTTSGLFGLYNMLQIAAGQPPVDVEMGWSGLHQMRDRATVGRCVPMVASEVVAERILALGLLDGTILCESLDEALAEAGVTPARRKPARSPQPVDVDAPMSGIGQVVAGWWRQMTSALGTV